MSVPSGVCLVCGEPWASTDVWVNLAHSQTHTRIEAEAAAVLLEVDRADLWDDAAASLAGPDQ